MFERNVDRVGYYPADDYDDESIDGGNAERGLWTGSVYRDRGCERELHELRVEREWGADGDEFQRRRVVERDALGKRELHAIGERHK